MRAVGWLLLGVELGHGWPDRWGVIQLGAVCVRGFWCLWKWLSLANGFCQARSISLLMGAESLPSAEIAMKVIRKCRSWW